MRLGADVKSWQEACDKLNPIKPGETPAEWVWREWCNRQLTMDIAISRAVHNAKILAGMD